MNRFSSPGQGGKCRNPECCKRALLNQERYEALKSEAETLFEKFRSQEHFYANVYFTKHAQVRMVERAVSQTELFTILELGYVIDYKRDSKLIIMGWIKLDEKRYRPIHVLLKINKIKDQYYGNIITLWDPRYSSHLYNETLERRICFCQPHDLDEFE